MLSTSDFEKLDDMLSKLKADMAALNDWEKGFISDQISRVEKYRESVFMSPKQMATIKKIYDAVIGDEEATDDEPEEDDQDELPF